MLECGPFEVGTLLRLFWMKRTVWRGLKRGKGSLRPACYEPTVAAWGTASDNSSSISVVQNGDSYASELRDKPVADTAPSGQGSDAGISWVRYSEHKDGVDGATPLYVSCLGDGAFVHVH